MKWLLALSLTLTTMAAQAKIPLNQCRLLGYALLGQHESSIKAEEFCRGADQYYDKNDSLGKAVCHARGAACVSDVSTPQAICKAAGGNCAPKTTTAQALCESFGKSCASNITIPQAVCEIANEKCLANTTLGSALCKAHGQNCFSGVSLSEAICKIGGGSCAANTPVNEALCNAIIPGYTCQPQYTLSYWIGYLVRFCN